jgi:hypothetical protein
MDHAVHETKDALEDSPGSLGASAPDFPAARPGRLVFVSVVPARTQRQHAALRRYAGQGQRQRAKGLEAVLRGKDHRGRACDLCALQVSLPALLPLPSSPSHRSIMLLPNSHPSAGTLKSGARVARRMSAVPASAADAASFDQFCRCLQRFEVTSRYGTE